MKNNIISKLLKQTTLETRLSVLNEMRFIDLITDLGYRDECIWTPEEDRILQKICEFSKKLALEQIEEFNKWKEDGERI